MTGKIDDATLAIMGASERKLAEMRSRLTKKDAQIIFAGLVHDGIEARKLTPEARAEIQAALDKLLEITK